MGKIHLFGRLRGSGRKKKDIAPLSFAISQRKSWKVNQSMEENAWVEKVSSEANFSMDLLAQFVDLWVSHQNVHPDANIEDALLGSRQAMGNTPLSQPMRCNFCGPSHPSCTRRFGKLGPLLKTFLCMAPHAK
jgi:hypothetical protein